MKNKYKKNKKLWEIIAFVLIVAFYVFCFYQLFQTNSSTYSEYTESFEFTGLIVRLETIITNFVFELGILIYFSKIILKREKFEDNKSMLINFGIINIINGALSLPINLMYGRFMPVAFIRSLLTLGIIQYFINTSLKDQAKYGEKIFIISCLGMSCYYLLTGSNDFNMGVLSLVLLYLSLIPYILSLDLKSKDKVSYSKDQIRYNSAGKKPLIIMVVVYFILNLIKGFTISNFITEIVIVIPILIFILLNERKMVTYTSIIAIFIEFVLLMINMSYSYHSVDIMIFLKVIVLIGIILTAKKNLLEYKKRKHYSNEKKKIDSKQKKKYDELLANGIISKKEYNEIIK